MNLKSEIAPKGIEFKPTEFVISGKNAVILPAKEYDVNQIRTLIGFHK